MTPAFTGRRPRGNVRLKDDRIGCSESASPWSYSLKPNGVFEIQTHKMRLLFRAEITQVCVNVEVHGAQLGVCAVARRLVE